MRRDFHNQTPHAAVTRDQIVFALEIALSTSKHSRRLQFPTNEAVDALHSTCLAAQINLRNDPRRRALAAATEALNSSLISSRSSVNSIAWLRRSFWETPVENDDNQEFLGHIEDDDNSFVHQSELMNELDRMDRSLESLLSAHILKIKYGMVSKTWRDIAPLIAEAFLAALHSTNAKQGRLNLPPVFLAAIFPHITGETPTPGNAKHRIAGTESSAD